MLHLSHTQLRQQLIAQSGLNEETADEMTKVLAEASRLQQANARLTAELVSMVGG